MKSIPFAILFGLFFTCEIPAQEWHTTTGGVFQGPIAGIERGALVLHPTPGMHPARIPLDQLDESSLEAVENWKRNRSPAERLPPPAWPDRIAIVSPEIVGPEERDGTWVFQTPHYIFRSDAPLTPAAIGEFSRLAETTVARVDAMPVRLPPIRKDSLYIAKLFRDRSGYENAGGTGTSAGRFLGGRGRPGFLIVPFESLGIREFAGGYSKSADFDSHVLIHEIGHQLVDDYIPFMPLWLNEGMAEYIALPRYSAAGFSCSPRDLLQAIRARQEDYRKLQRAFDKAAGPLGDKSEFQPIPLRVLLSPGELNRILESGDLRRTHEAYFTALVLTFHLFHFDGNGEGRRLRAYFEALGDAVEFLQSRGARGALPEGVDSMRSHRSPELSSALNRMLPTPDEADTLQSEITKAFARFGTRIQFP